MTDRPLVSRVLDAFDLYLWDPLKRRFPWLDVVDGASWKTWVWHAVLTIALGHALALLPWVTVPMGVWFMAYFYLFREVLQRVEWVNGRLRFSTAHGLDGLLDVAFPLVAAALWTGLGLP